MPDPLTLEQEAPLRRLPRKPRKPLPPYTDILVPVGAAASAGLLWSGLPDLIGADGLFGHGKCALMAGSAGIVSYAITQLAVEKGARQAAIGTPGAKLLSLASMGSVGLGLYTATFSALTIDSVDRLRLEELGRHEAAFIESHQTAAMQAAQVIPVVRTVLDDLRAKEECERVSSCISGAGNGGVGPVSRALSSERQRAESILASLEAGARHRVQAFEEINNLQSRFHDLLADDALSLEERRAAVSDTAMLISQTANTLKETDPLSFGVGYAEELSTPTGASDKLDSLRRGYALQLRAVVDAASQAAVQAPQVPPKTGVSDTLGRIAHFLPVAMLVAVVELMFPITFWFYTYFAFLARLAQDEQPDRQAPDPVRRNGHDRPRDGRSGRGDHV